MHGYLKETGFQIESIDPECTIRYERLENREMKKIMLCCSSGMSTSLLVKKMKEEADKRGLNAEIQAFGAAEFDLQMPHYQVVLLGPQVKYMLAELQLRAAAHGVPVDTINMMDYGMQRGDRVLDHALTLIG